jgi:DNA-binding XRE family transcriptional regulator
MTSCGKEVCKLFQEANMREALNLYIEEPADSKDLAPLPDSTIQCSKNIVEVPVDPLIAFTFLVRWLRIKHELTQQEMANRMGFNEVYSYQRLEARKCNPSLKIISKLKDVFPELSVDYAIN